MQAPFCFTQTRRNKRCVWVPSRGSSLRACRRVPGAGPSGGSSESGRGDAWSWRKGWGAMRRAGRSSAWRRHPACKAPRGVSLRTPWLRQPASCRFAPCLSPAALGGSFENEERGARGRGGRSRLCAEHRAPGRPAPSPVPGAGVTPQALSQLQRTWERFHLIFPPGGGIKPAQPSPRGWSRYAGTETPAADFVPARPVSQEGLGKGEAPAAEN